MNPEIFEFIHWCTGRWILAHSVMHYPILDFCRAMLCISAAIAFMRCLSVRLSRSWVISKRVHISAKFFHHQVATPA